MCCCYMQGISIQSYATGVWACGTIARGESGSCDSDFGFFRCTVASSRTARPSTHRASSPHASVFVRIGAFMAWPSLGLGKRIKAAPPAASTQPSPLTKWQPRQNGLPDTSHGAPPSRGGPPRGPQRGACQACMKYLDETWANRSKYPCNQTWAEAQGYDDCSPQTLSFEQGMYLEDVLGERGFVSGARRPRAGL